MPPAETGAPTVLHHMETGTTTALDLRPLGQIPLGGLGTTVITQGWEAEHGFVVHLLSDPRQGMTDRVVTGLPEGARSLSIEAYAEGAFVLQYKTGTTDAPVLHQAVVDVAGARITNTYRVWDSWGDVALSGTHIAWVGWANGVRGHVLRTAPRGSGTVTTKPTGGSDGWVLGLLDGWAVSGNRTNVEWGEEDKDYGLYATPLAGGTPKRLLAHATSVVPGPDGTLLAMGGTLTYGEGLYRISKGTDGVPRAKLVAGTGQPTKVTLLDSEVPAVIDPTARKTTGLRWQLSRRNVHVELVLRHKASGEFAGIDPAEEGEISEDGWLTYDWDGTVGIAAGRRHAPNGAYEWTLTAKPRNGIGPTLEAKGGFTVRRAPAPHDYTDDGSPDLLGLTNVGQLIGSNTHHDGAVETVGNHEDYFGEFWEKYSALVPAGNVGGTSRADLLARDGAGVLWLYTGKGDGKFATRIKVGGGWNTYDRMTAGGDVTGDGRADLVARDRSGVLWLYRATGSATVPYKSRQRISGGWGGYNELTSTGNIAGGAAGDLVARDKDGVLWLHRGRGDGTFGARTRIGSGWNTYQDLVGWGDADGDRKPDLYARDKAGKSWFYEGTGNATAPFARRVPLSGFFTDRPYTEVY
ncbi:FG-GAP repeat domain-containing protein [Streptomyces sp. NPDC086023]|uniref:FG-GAP repeat domain-containing protein n=1 Tax=Streptomyces sp. NPDC086023 TaxID=3365746 RepID=UPI0037D3489C